MENVSLVLVILTLAAIGYIAINFQYRPALKPPKTLQALIIISALAIMYVFFGMYFSSIAIFDKNVSALIIKLFTFFAFFMHALVIFKNKRARQKGL